MKTDTRTPVVGERIRFTPNTGDGNRWWTVRATDGRYVVATRKEFSHTLYTIVDLTGWTWTYNGVGPGVVRSSLNTLGGGFDITTYGADAVLDELHSGRHELSQRRVVAVEAIEYETEAGHA